MALLLPNVVKAGNATFNFDDPSRIDLLINEQPYTGKLVAGENLIECSSYRIIAKPGFILDKVLETYEGYIDDPVRISDNSCFSPCFYDKYIKVFTKVAAEAQTGSFVLNVDKASAVTLSVTETGRTIDLVDGDNTIKYDPTTEKQLKVYSSLTAQLPLYSVTAPNSPGSIAKSGNIYFINLPCTGPVEVVSQYPQEDHYINFTFDEGSAGFVKKVTKDTPSGEELEMKDNKVKVNAGTVVYIHGNIDDYDINSFTVNNEAKEFENPYRLIVLQSDFNIGISAKSLTEVPVYIDVNDASMVKAYYGSTMYPGDEIVLKNGENEVNININKNVMFFASSNPALYKIVSVKVDGEELEPLYDGRVQTDYLYGGEKITVVMETRERNLQAVVFVDDAEKLNWNMTSVLGQPFALTHGYNYIKFCAEDNPFMLKGGSTPIYVYIDDNDVTPAESGYMFNLSEWAVLKIYAATENEPNFHILTFAEEGFDKVKVVADEIKTISQRVGYEYLEGTKVEITPVDETIKGVSVDGIALTADSDNKFTFTVAGPHNVTFSTTPAAPGQDDAGVEGIYDESPRSLVIFNLQGQRVPAADLESLPAGIFVVNGKKVLIK